MRRILCMVLAAVLLPAVVFAASVKQYDITSDAQSATVSLSHAYCVDITVRSDGTGPTDVIIDYLFPTNDLAEWGSFQTRGSGSQLSFSFPELNPTLEVFSDQWVRVWWVIPAGFDWTWPVQFWVQYDFTGTRAQTLAGVSDDYQVIPGATYTALTSNVMSTQDVYDFADHCEANTITNQVKGHYGTGQRVHTYLQSTHPGDCTSMSMHLAAALRHLGIPAPIAIGYMVAGTFQIPYGFGLYRNFTISANPLDGHCFVGGWRENNTFSPLDANNGFAQLEPLQTVMYGYFEDPADAQYTNYTFGGSRFDHVSSYAYTNGVAAITDQTYTWRQTRSLTETWGANNTYELFAQKVSSSYKGGSGIVGPGDGTTGVGEDPPGVQTPLVIFPATQRPVRSGETLFVEIGAPEHGAETSLHMFDVRGRMVPNFGFDDRHISGNSAENMRLPDGLSSGVYYVLLTFDGQKADSDPVVVIR